MIIQWDSDYEATPANTLVRSLIDDEIRQVIYGIRERMSVEHRWGPRTAPDTDPESLSYQLYNLTQGYHIPGGTTICDIGDETDRDVVSSPQLGSLFIVQDGSNYSVNIYTSEGWQSLSTIDHLELTGTSDNDHPQYVLIDGGAMTGALDMDGFTINTQETGQTFGQFTLYRHRNESHGDIDNIDAIVDKAVTFDKLRIVSQEITTALDPYEEYTFTSYPNGFFPQVYVYSASILSGGNPIVTMGLNRVYNTGASGSSYTIRIRREYIA
jgi:hypothetical protein